MPLASKTPSRRAPRRGARAAAPQAPRSSPRLIALLLVGLLLVGGALWLRSSAWLQERRLVAMTLPELEAAARSRPDDALTSYYLAKRYYLDRRFDDASAAYETAVRLAPDSARSHLGLGLSLYEMGRLDRAREEFERALRLDPRSSWAEYMLGTVAWFEGKIPDALTHVRRATELDARSDPAWYALGVCYIHLHRYDESVAPLEQAIARKETNPRYHTALAEVLVYRGRTEEGRRHLERALQIDPNYGPACALMGNFYLHKASGLDALDQAEVLLLRATKVKTYHPEQVYLDLGELYLQKAQYRKALDALQTSIKIDSRDERPYYSLAQVYRRLGNPAGAAAAERQFQRISRMHVQLQTLEARVFHNPTSPAAHLELARLYRDIGLRGQAIEQYAACLHLDPNAVDVAKEAQALLAQRSSVTDRQPFIPPTLR